MSRRPALVARSNAICEPCRPETARVGGRNGGAPPGPAVAAQAPTGRSPDAPRSGDLNTFSTSDTGRWSRGPKDPDTRERVDVRTGELTPPLCAVPAMRRDKAEVLRRQAVALPYGKRRGLHFVEADLSGSVWRCEAPRAVAIATDGEDGNHAVSYQVRCRRCAACRRQAQVTWANRIREEMGNATRTWWITLTFRPEHHATFRRLARAKMPEGSEQDWQEWHIRFAKKDVQDFLKRLRKKTSARFRYICVTELHKEKLFGFPHFHMFLHEQEQRISKRDIQAAWPLSLGFSHMRERSVQERVGYLLKYITKDNVSRVMCSKRYGPSYLIGAQNKPSFRNGEK